MKYDEICAVPPTVITQEQRIRFYEQGYLEFPGLFNEDWLKPLKNALAEIVESTREIKESTQRIDIEPDHCAENPRLRRVAYVDEYDPIFWQLCKDSIIPDIAADLLGPNIRFREIMMNFKWSDGGAEVKWHQDLAFYPHTHSGTTQFLLLLDGATPEQGPLQVVPSSHRGRLFPHYDDQWNWTGAIAEEDYEEAGVDRAVMLTGSPGTLTVHHSLTVHGSGSNYDSAARPAFVLTYAAADAMPYTAPSYPSVNYHTLVRGVEPRYAHHEDLNVPLPPDWWGGYTSIFEHQIENSTAA